MKPPHFCKLTPQEQAFEDRLKEQVRAVIRELYAERYAGREGYILTPVQIPEEICDGILDHIAYSFFLGQQAGPTSPAEFRVMARKVAERYMPGPLSEPSTSVSPDAEPPA